MLEETTYYVEVLLQTAPDDCEWEYDKEFPPDGEAYNKAVEYAKGLKVPARVVHYVEGGVMVDKRFDND